MNKIKISKLMCITALLSICCNAAIGQTLPLDRSSWADMNADGRLDFVSDRGEIWLQTADGEFVRSNISSGTLPVLLSNDNKPDFFVMDGKYGGWNLTIVRADGSEYYLEDSMIDPYGRLVPFDHNGDGRTDLMADGSTIFEQQADGSFTKRPLMVISYQEWVNPTSSSAADKWNEKNTSSGIVSTGWDEAMNPDIFVGGGSNGFKSLDSDADWKPIDYNNDGRPDFLDVAGGRMLLNFGDCRFVSTALRGNIVFRDLNDDRRPDFVLFNSSTNEVTANIFQPDGSVKSQKLVASLALDAAIWCYDFDKDGDVDVLLPFSYSQKSGASYLLLAINDGAGRFSTLEYSYDEHLKFLQCVDIDNDGYMDVLACIGRNIRWLKGGQRKDWILQSEIIIEDNSGDDLNTAEALAADIDNDGQCEFFDGRHIGYVKLSIAKANTAPQKPAAPALYYEQSTGWLKVSWTKGADAESSASDLSYALRIGTAPGKDDILYAFANADGLRTNLNEGNMGYYLSKTLNTTSWPRGKYYIAVQAVDPMCMGSKWSDETVFDKSELSAKFMITGGVSTADTLSLVLGDKCETGLAYEWDMADAQLISTGMDGAIQRVVFPKPGEKQLALVIKDAAGKVLASHRESVFVGAAKYYTEPDLGYGDVWQVLDFDCDGLAEMATEKGGLWENIGNGQWQKLKKIFNADLTISKNSAVGDFNLDGLPDILDGTRLITNLGNKNGIVEDSPNFLLNDQVLGVADFDNDGQQELLINNDGDYCIPKSDGAGGYIYHNIGDWRIVYNQDFADINRDGWLDIVSHDSDKGVKCLINKGGLQFELQDYKWPYETVRPDVMADFNGDGYPDFFSTSINNGFLYVAYGDKDYSYTQKAEIAVPYHDLWPDMLVLDVDNNGCDDIVIESCVRDGGGSDNTYLLCTVYFYEDGLYRIGDLASTDCAFYYKAIPFDWMGDGNTGVIYESFRMRTNAGNSKPAAPQGLYARQSATHLNIGWDAASDKETPVRKMRYNLSVKKAGTAVGDKDAFIISPMNGLNAGAAIAPKYHYIEATQYQIPLHALPVGDYEVCVQTIDGYGATSPFSEMVKISVKAGLELDVPAEVYATLPATLSFLGNNYETLEWNLDGGRIVEDSQRQKTVIWDTPGTKTVRLTNQGTIREIEVYVKAMPDLKFRMPETAMKQQWVDIDMPPCNHECEWLYRRSADEEFRPLKPAYSYLKQVVEVEQAGGKCRAKFGGEGYFELMLSVTIAGNRVTEYRAVNVFNGSTQELDLVYVDAATGKNMLVWTNPAGQQDFVTGTNIYKETERSGEYYLLAHVDNTTTSYIDMTSNPDAVSARYYLAKSTSLGYDMPAGKIHTTSHAMICCGMDNKWNIMWNLYDGASVSSYRILRGSDAANMQPIATVSGNVMSYTDTDAPAGENFHYAVEYVFETTAGAPAYPARAGRSVVYRSNIVDSQSAQQVEWASEIVITSATGDFSITDSQPELQLFAKIYPLDATLKRINWSIARGGDIATISQSGHLATNGKAGTIVVRASATDGSGVVAEATVQADALSGISVIEVRSQKPAFNYSGSILKVDGLLSNLETVATVYAVSGRAVKTARHTGSLLEISCANLPRGVYVVRVMNAKQSASLSFVRH